MGTSSPTNLVLFDGVCNLCNGFVQFLIRQDRRQVLKFGSLQSEEAQRLLAKKGVDQSLTSIIYFRHGNHYKRSTAALYILRDLGGLWWMTQIFWIIPRPIRDAIYDWVGRNRYRWFGKKSSCMVPTRELRERFINDTSYTAESPSSVAPTARAGRGRRRSR